MNLLELVAYAIICGNQPVNLEKDLLLHQKVMEIAVALELADPRETKYLSLNDATTLQSRFVKFYDTPYVSDIKRFPTKEYCSAALDFNRKYRQTIEAKLLAHWDTNLYVEVMREIDELYHVWDLIRDAHCDFYYITVRREALLKLKEKLGYENYYNGKIPPHVPVWRFQELR